MTTAQHPPCLVRSIDGIDVVRDQARRQARAEVDGIPIIVRLARADLVTPLPKQVAAHAVGGEGERGLLPGLLDVATGIRAVWVFFG